DVGRSDTTHTPLQEPGDIETEISEADGVDKLLPYENCFLRFPLTYPNWLSEEDVVHYHDKFMKTGLTGGLNYYRALNLNWEITAPWTGAQVKVPVKFIVGALDLTYNAPGVKYYIHKGGMKRDVPLLQEVVVLEGVGHFLQEEKSDVITQHIYDFIKKF
ncbi:Epoxide hydrolase A, partial [Bienertia sinuspersici]